MAELLVLRKQRMNRTMVPGDVVTVLPDGWAWGSAERGPNADDMWFVLEVPGVPVAAFAELLQPITANGRTVMFRRVHLNLLALGDRPTLVQVMDARVEKHINPLLS